MNIDRRLFFRRGIMSIAGGAAALAKRYQPPDSPYDLLRDHRLHLMTRRELFPAEVYVDGKKIHRALTVIGRPKENDPGYGAVEYCLLNNGRVYARGDRVATDWIFGTVVWRRAVGGSRGDRGDQLAVEPGMGKDGEP